MMEPDQIRNVIEACLLVAGRPMSVAQLDALFGEDEDKPDRAAIRDALAALVDSYEGRGIELVEVAGGWRLQSRKTMEHWIGRLFVERPPRYSRALLETLVLIAYRQPITRGEIEEVRGVAVSSNIVRTLQDRQWVREVGHKDVPGKPALLGTTSEFLDYFNLKRLDELPALGEASDLEGIEAVLAAELGVVEDGGEAANDGSDATDGADGAAGVDAEDPDAPDTLEDGEPVVLSDADTVPSDDAAEPAGEPIRQDVAGAVREATNDDAVASGDTENVEGVDVTVDTEATDEADSAEGTNEADSAEGTNDADSVEGTNEADSTEGTNEADSAEGTNEADSAEGTNDADGTDIVDVTEGMNDAADAEGTDVAADPSVAANTDVMEGTGSTAGSEDAAGTPGADGSVDDRSTYPADAAGGDDTVETADAGSVDEPLAHDEGSVAGQGVPASDVVDVSPGTHEASLDAGGSIDSGNEDAGADADRDADSGSVEGAGSMAESAVESVAEPPAQQRAEVGRIRLRAVAAEVLEAEPSIGVDAIETEPFVDAEPFVAETPVESESSAGAPVDERDPDGAEARFFRGIGEFAEEHRREIEAREALERRSTAATHPVADADERSANDEDRSGSSLESRGDHPGGRPRPDAILPDVRSSDASTSVPPVSAGEAEPAADDGESGASTDDAPAADAALGAGSDSGPGTDDPDTRSRDDEPPDRSDAVP